MRHLIDPTPLATANDTVDFELAERLFYSPKPPSLSDLLDQYGLVAIAGALYNLHRPQATLSKEWYADAVQTLYAYPSTHQPLPTGWLNMVCVIHDFLVLHHPTTPPSPSLEAQCNQVERYLLSVSSRTLRTLQPPLATRFVAAIAARYAHLEYPAPIYQLLTTNPTARVLPRLFPQLAAWLTPKGWSTTFDTLTTVISDGNIQLDHLRLIVREAQKHGKKPNRNQLNALRCMLASKSESSDHSTLYKMTAALPWILESEFWWGCQFNDYTDPEDKAEAFVAMAEWATAERWRQVVEATRALPSAHSSRALSEIFAQARPEQIPPDRAWWAPYLAMGPTVARSAIGLLPHTTPASQSSLLP